MNLRTLVLLFSICCAFKTHPRQSNVASAQSQPELPPPIEELENFYNGIDIEGENLEAETRNAVNSKMQRWPNRTIFFVISDNYTEDEANNVRKAVTVFNDKTCLNFEERTVGNVDNQRFLLYQKSPNLCGTKVGFDPAALAGSAHKIKLSPSCLCRVGIIQHETLHVLGLYHEQSRYDRDGFVRIIYKNIPAKYHTQFVVYPPIYTRTFKVPYDYGSLMHYSSNAFAKDPSKPSMQAVENGKLVSRQMGQIDGPTSGDLKKINLMYECGN